MLGEKLEEKLIRIKKIIDESKEQKAKSEGKISHMEGELKTLLKIDSLDMVEDKIQGWEDSLKEMDKNIEERMGKLEKLPEFN